MHWNQLLIDQLIRSGVTTFCLSPGSRSTPLAVAIARDKRLDYSVHFDERGMAFHALGRAKASKKPVAIVVTSGGAVGNLFPAVMEAQESRIPLILLTADRPQELRGRGANQTADQVKIFGSYVHVFVDLPPPDQNLSGAYLCSTVAYAVDQARLGPVHLNCMFREPFFEEPRPEFTPMHTEYASSIHSSLNLERYAELFSGKTRGVIVVGHSCTVKTEPIVALSQKLGFPILADIGSGLRSSGNPGLIAHYEAILDKSPQKSPEVVLHLGDRIVSKRLLKWLKSPIYCLVVDHDKFYDPESSVTHRITYDPTQFCTELLFLCQAQEGWSQVWQELSSHYKKIISSNLQEETRLNEIEVVRTLAHVPSGWAIFIANSMPIRDADAHLFPEVPIGPIFTSRGLSGIDGNIAMLTGLAHGAKSPLIALIGDQAALHDLNSLAFISKSIYPIILIVINNSGGGIFSFLPIKSDAALDEFFAAEHNFNFSEAAALFHIPYHRSETKEELLETIKRGKSCLIEVTTHRQENYKLHQELLSEKELLCK